METPRHAGRNTDRGRDQGRGKEDADFDRIAERVAKADPCDETQRDAKTPDRDGGSTNVNQVRRLRFDTELGT
jgi:hypothetical protein